MSLGKELYSGASSFGRVWALFGAITATFVGIILIGIGIFIMTRKSDRKAYSATVVYVNGPNGPPCQKTQDNPVQYTCTITIKYSGYSSPINIDYMGSKMYYVGETITVYVKNGNPSDVSLSGNVPKWLGLVFIIPALLMIVGSWFWYWASRKWKFVAAAEGGSAALDILSGGRI
jgi:hypothetical protein